MFSNELNYIEDYTKGKHITNDVSDPYIEISCIVLQTFILNPVLNYKKINSVVDIIDIINKQIKKVYNEIKNETNNRYYYKFLPVTMSKENYIKRLKVIFLDRDIQDYNYYFLLLYHDQNRILIYRPERSFGHMIEYKLNREHDLINLLTLGIVSQDSLNINDIYLVSNNTIKEKYSEIDTVRDGHKEIQNENMIINKSDILNGKVKKYLVNYDDAENGYFCYSKNSYQSDKIRKYHCNRIYDSEGNKLINPGVYDRPCKYHEECPFYKKNLNYDNNRGGCIHGMCELPIGLTQISPRKYIGEPFCHNCIDSNTFTCCEDQKQKINKEYSFFITPDYAFTDDFKPRIIQSEILRKRDILP